MDQHELAQELYPDFRSDYGDGDYAWNEAWDKAGEIIRLENARQYACQDYPADSGEGEVVPTFWDNKRAPTPIVASGISGGVAISALGSPAVIFGFGLLVLVGGVYVLYKWRSNDDAQTSSDESTSNAQTERMNRLEALSQKTADTSDQTDEQLAKSAENINKLSETVDTFMNESSSQRIDEHNGKFGALDQALEDHSNLVTAIRGDLQKHFEQPGSMFYLSTEYSVASLDAHFRRFKDPKDIDKFILGETRTKVLEMAELWKVVIA